MRFATSFTLALTLTLSVQAQLPPEKALATMQPAAGFQVELFAAEPMLINPTSIDVDHKGRVWVAEAVNYRRVAFKRPIIREAGDRIVVLTDKDGDGKADDSTVFYQGKDLYGPLSVCVIPQADGKTLRVLVAQSPDILEFWDKDGDLKADGPPKKFLTGFGGFDHDHGVHGINIGPDGKLYFTVGDAGVTALQGTDKNGPVFKSNTTTIHKGTVWRCDMDGSHLELIAHNFRNNYECCVDSFGEIWLSDNDDDGNQQTRICHVMPGGNYGYGPRGAGESHWHEEQPGIVHKTLRTGFGSPTGITFYEGALFPEKYRGSLLHCDAGPREVRAFFRKPKGAGYELDKEVILTSTDTWFRPSDVCVAPDGSIFVADWYDKGVGGHAMNDPQDGRIYRLTPKGHKGYKVPEVKLDTKDGVLAALGSPCLASRGLAIAKMRAMTAADLNAWVHEPGQGVRGRPPGLEEKSTTARVLWQFKRFLESPEPDKETRQAAELLLFVLLWPDDGIVDPLWVRILSDGGLFQNPARFDIKLESRLTRPQPGPAVAREWLLALRNVPAQQAVKSFYDLAKHYDGKDIFFRAALNIACGTDPKRRDEILADFDKHFPEWNDKVADLVWELRPKSVLPRLGKLLADAKLTGPQKARIIDILASSDDAAAGRSMLALLKTDAAPEVKARVIEAFRVNLPTRWAALRHGEEVRDAITALLKSKPDQLTGLRLAAAAPDCTTFEEVVELARDKAAGAEVRTEAVRTLGRMATVNVVDGLRDLTADPAVASEAVAALGLQAAGRADGRAAQAALAALQGLVTNAKTAVGLRKATLDALSGTRPGTIWLLDQHAKGDLPKELVADAGRLLRNSPFERERSRAQLLFPAPGKLNPKKLPAMAELAKRTGDAARGKLVWDASFAGAAQCAKCHTVRGVGGQVGPDLSMIGKKGGKENLLESVLVPSKAIADQYVQVSVTTTADVTVSGLVVADTPQAIALRDANGKDTVIPKADVASQKKLMISIMPEDIVAALNEDELIDLVAYMATLQTAAITPMEFKIAGPFAGKDMLDALNKDHGLEKSTVDAKWKTIRADAKGYFDLGALHGAAGNNSASYLFVEFDSPLDQDAEVLLGTDDGAKLWVNDKEVFKAEQTRAASPGQDKVAVKLKKGANAVLLKVANGNNPHGFYFTLLSKDEVKVK